MSTPVANYRDERAAIESLSLEGCEKRILLFHGASGSGKTTLLSHCGMQFPKLLQVPIQLRAGSVGVAEILSRSLDRLGADRLPRLLQRVEQLQSARVEIEGNRSFGINNRIEVALNSNGVADRDDRRVSLTEALFEDLRMFERPLLFVFDTYDQAGTEVQEWISGPFLARTAGVIQVRVLIAGQIVPSANNIEWGGCCKLHRLIGVPDAQEWLPIFEHMGRVVPKPTDSSLSWLEGACHVLHGDPSRIMQMIEGLPVREGFKID
jgi:hypothetical protein